MQCLNAIYRTIAAALTEWENHRTARAHDNALLVKRFVFEACDAYAGLFFLAFVPVRAVTKFRSRRRRGDEEGGSWSDSLLRALRTIHVVAAAATRPSPPRYHVVAAAATRPSPPR